MITVCIQDDVVSAPRRETRAWGIGATAAKMIPQGWDPGEAICVRNGGKLDRDAWDQILADGDSLFFIRAPGIQVAVAPAVLEFLISNAAIINAITLSVIGGVISRILLPSLKPNKPGDVDSKTHGFNNLQSNEQLEGTPIPVPYGRHRMAPPIINQVLRTSLDRDGNPVSEIWLLMVISDGEVDSIGDKSSDGGPFLSDDSSFVSTLKINNQPAENLDGVEVHVRMGTPEQEVIPGFAQPSTQYSVDQTLRFPTSLHASSFSVVGGEVVNGGTGYTDGATVTLTTGSFTTAAQYVITTSGGMVIGLTLLTPGVYSSAPSSPGATSGGGGSGLTIRPIFDKLVSAIGDSSSDPTGGTNSPTANTAIATAGVSVAASVNITKWDEIGNPAAYTMGEDADEFALILTLPQGLGDFRTGKAINTVVYQVRYRPVDDVGTPFGNYIVLDAERISLARTGQFQLEYRRRFYDYTGYSPPSNGLFLRARTGTNGTTNRGASCVVDTTKVPVLPKADTDFSFSAWVRTNATLPNGSARRLFQWSGTNVGIAVDISRISTGQANLIVVVGTGTTTSTNPTVAGGALSALVTFAANQQFTHVAITYDGDGSGSTTARVRMYVNGVLVVSLSVPQMQFDPSQTIRVCSDSVSSPTRGYDCDMDEPTFWNKALSAFEVSRIYNFGAPLTVPDDSPGLIIGGRFDSGTTTSPAFGPAVLAGSPNWTLGDGAGGATPNVNPEISNQPTAENGIVKTAESGTLRQGRYLIEVMRINVEDEEVGLVSELAWSSIELVTFQEFSYPGCGLLAVKVRATDQISGGTPLVTVRVDGRKVNVWDGVDAVNPTFVEQWSRNPAWIAADILTNDQYGLGNVFSLEDLDLVAFQELADYCDELIYDNLSRILIVNAQQFDAADGALPTALQGGSQDFVRYRVASIPSNWVQPTSGLVNSGKYMRPKITGSPASLPSWLSTAANATAEEIRYVEFVSSGGYYYVWCNAPAIGASSSLYTPTPSGTNYIEIEVHDRRYFYDGVFDRPDFKAWDAVIQVLQVARAVPVRMGQRISIFTDKEDAPVALFSMGNIVPGTFKSTSQGTAERPNAELGEYYDEDLDYERTFVPDEHPDLTDPTKPSAFNFRRVRLEGVVRRGQAKRSLRRDLNAFNLIRRMVAFEAAIGAMKIQVGNLIAVSHDVVGFGSSGRLLSDSADQNSVKLDRPITLVGGHSYQIQVENAASGITEIKPITSSAGTYAAGATIAIGSGGFSFVPEKGDVYAAGEVGKESKSYRVVEATFDPRTLRRKIRALEYDAQSYDDDFGTLQQSPTALTLPTVPLIPQGVENLVVQEGNETGPDGSVRPAASISFSHPAETFQAVSGTDVYVSEGTSESGRGSAQHIAFLPRDVVSLRIDHPFRRGTTYTIWVIPRAHGSVTSKLIASFVQFTPRGLVKVPKAVLNLRATISGERVVYEWDEADGENLDHSAVVELRRGGWILGQPVAIVPAQARATGAIPAWAGASANDQGQLAPDVYARVKLRTGQYSAAAKVETNPEPVANDGHVLQFNAEDTAWS